MNKNEVLEELFAAEEAAMRSLHPTEDAVKDLLEKLGTFQDTAASQTTDLSAQVEELKKDLTGRIRIAQDLYQDLEPDGRESETGKRLLSTIDALETQLRGITNVADAFADLKLIFS